MGEKIFVRGKEIRKLIKELAEAGEIGVATEAFESEDLADRISPRQANGRLRSNIHYTRTIFQGTGFSIPNAERGKYRLIRESKSLEAAKAKVEQTIFEAEDASVTLDLGAKPQETTQEDYVVLPNDTKLSGLGQEEKALLTFFIAKSNMGETASHDEVIEVLIAAGYNPETDLDRLVWRSVSGLREKLLETDFDLINLTKDPAHNAAYIFRKRIPGEDLKDDSLVEEEVDEKGLEPTQPPPPRVAMEPAIETSAKPEIKTATRYEKNQIIQDVVCDVLTKMAEGRLHTMSRNIRVHYGNFLPPRTTLPQLFGDTVTDDSLKNEFTSAFNSLLNRLWYRSTNDPTLSEKEREMATQCARLKQQNRSIQAILSELRAQFSIRLPS